MPIEHTSRSTEDKPEYISVLVRYGGQQDASTSKVSIWSANQKCHTTLEDSQINQPQNSTKVNVVSQRSMQTVAAARSTQPSQSQHPASRIVPKNADSKNRKFGRVLGQFDLALTKVNASQRYGRNPRPKTEFVAC